MKRKLFFLILMLPLFFQHCSKDNNKGGPDLNKGLFAYFKLDNDFIDYTGNNSNPTHFGTVIPAYDKNGNADNAMYFKSGLLIFKTDSISADQLTVSFWFKPENLTVYGNFITVSKEYAFGIEQHADQIGWMISAPPKSAYILGTIKAGWTHIAGTTDGKEVKLYLNGILVATKPHPGKTYGTKTVYVANWNGNNFPCTLDDLRYYDHALTGEEVKLLAKQ